MTSLRAAITSKRRFGHQNRLYFLNPECVRIPWIAAQKKIPVENFRPRSVLPKKSLFREFIGSISWNLVRRLSITVWRPTTWTKLFGLTNARWQLSRGLRRWYYKIYLHRNQLKLGVFRKWNRWGRNRKGLLSYTKTDIYLCRCICFQNEWEPENWNF